VSLLFRYVFREVAVSSLIGAVLFTFVLYLQKVGDVMELLVRADIAARDVGYLFLLTLPFPLPYTIPIGVLVGVLLALGRMSTDGEITAMRAAGVPGLRAVRPIGVFCLFAAIACGAVTLWLSPWAARERVRVGQSLQISQATAKIPPRVFIEKVFPDKVLYVRDVEPGDSVIRWKGLFMADTRAPESRGSVDGLNAAVDGPRITIADEALVVARPEQSRLQIHLPRASIFEQSYDPRKYQRQTIEVGDETIDTEPETFEGRSRELDQTETIDLWRMRQTGEKRVEAGIFFHQRFALPIACLVLPLVGIPLSISTQRAGRSVGVVLALGLVFVYYMCLLAGTALAQERMMPPGPAIWAANVIFGLVGVRLLAQLDSPGRSDWLAILSRPLQRLVKRLRSASDTGEIPQFDETRRQRAERKEASERRMESLFDIFFPITDRYVLQRFLFYFALMLAAFVSIWIIFSFFELLSDMLAHGKLALFLPYIYYLLPFLFYETAPLAVMVATLVCFGLLAKHHELTAFRACGISLYRLAAPVLLTSVVVSAALFALDQYTLPETNRRQDAIRDEIKDRPARTFLNADRQWTFGQDERIFYHRYFDWTKREMAPIFIYDFRLEPFDLRRHIYAERARWDEQRRAWVFEKGWVRELDHGHVTHFEQFDQRTFADIRETPEYFRKENKPYQQMNSNELGDYIRELNQAGFETSELIVQWHKKFSFPTFAFAMALLALPFAMVTGHRGALTPVAFSLVVAISYYALSALFMQLGRASQLTPMMAAWAPGLIFGLTGGYLFLRVRT
jgi:LPS export ABC transporter permease LptG/LPS export ABC transporter permease LptF